MSVQPVISPRDLAARLGDRNLLVVDCRFDLADAVKGERDYRAAHIPGAVYANLDRDLSDLTKHGLGRHPLPDDAAFSASLSRWGFTSEKFVVTYDDAGGALAAARLWWMLHLIGHDNAAVLDGGFSAWREENLPTQSGAAPDHNSDVHVAMNRDQVVLYDELERGLADGSMLLLDARAAPRFRGEVEPVDAKAGHVPGAVNRPFPENLGANGRFKSPERLREEFAAVLNGRAPGEVVQMCGSGVTACHNLLAMARAGLGGSRVFAPSWSGWIGDPNRPVSGAR